SKIRVAVQQPPRFWPWRVRRHHSTVTPLALIGFAHFSVSSLTSLARYSGVAWLSDTISAPSEPSLSATTGEWIASIIAPLSFLTIGAGAAFGRKIAFQV